MSDVRMPRWDQVPAMREPAMPALRDYETLRAGDFVNVQVGDRFRLHGCTIEITHVEPNPNIFFGPRKLVRFTFAGRG